MYKVQVLDTGMQVLCKGMQVVFTGMQVLCTGMQGFVAEMQVLCTGMQVLDAPRASRAKAEHSRRGGRAKPGSTFCKNNNTAAFGGCAAAASPPQLLFLQRVLPGLALPPRLECSALARLARLLCLASARSALS